jgi:hypothetical protein
MKYYTKLFAGILVAMVAISCNDKFEGEIVKDNRPEIPVTFDGATTVGFNPYYTVKYAGASSPISITLSIPSDSRLKIKQVENIVAGATSINVATITSAPVARQYLATPAAVNGTTYTLNTTITEFNTKVASSARITAPPDAGTFAERAFMIKLRMDDDSFIIPVQCRIRITP